MILGGIKLDTIFAGVSCLLSFVALFVGARSYKKCKVLESSFNDSNVIIGNGNVNTSQRVAGNVINNYCDTDALLNISNSNFEICLQQAYSYFEESEKSNLQQILVETKRLINEQKLSIAGLSKIDWINVYFESAKNTSDTCMQQVWAKVLAKELECPDSFSYKTLDVLKNMSVKEYSVFERMNELVIDEYVLDEKICRNYGLEYLDMVMLSENGLLNLNYSVSKNTVPINDTMDFVYNGFLIRVKNNTNHEIKYKKDVHLLTSAAMELRMIVPPTANLKYAKDFARSIKTEEPELEITVHLINKEIGKVIDYQDEVLFRV